MSELLLITATGLAREVRTTVWSDRGHDVARPLDIHNDLAGAEVNGPPVPETIGGSVHQARAILLGCPDSSRPKKAGVGRRAARGIASACYTTAFDAQVRTAGVHYPVPVHFSRAYADPGVREGSFPVTGDAGGRVPSLPLYPHITEAQQEQGVGTLTRATGGA